MIRSCRREQILVVQNFKGCGRTGNMLHCVLTLLDMQMPFSIEVVSDIYIGLWERADIAEERKPGVLDAFKTL